MLSYRIWCTEDACSLRTPKSQTCQNTISRIGRISQTIIFCFFYHHMKIRFIFMIIVVVWRRRYVISTRPTQPDISIDLPSIHCDDRVIPIDLVYAKDDASRIQWLMYQTGLWWMSGMLFVFSDEQMRSFWMKNTLIPLDMIFIDSGYNIVHIHTGAKIQDLTPIHSIYPSQYVLEVNSGRAWSQQITTDCKIDIS